jgi:predicted ester cyclase
MADPREVTERGLQAWRARDFDAFANCYADSATIAGPGGMALQGADGARQFMGMWADGVPDNEITIEHEWVAGPVVIQEGIFSGTHTGTLMTPDGQAIPATGRSLRAAYVDVFETDGDRITAERLYFDQVELLTQLGLMPDPAAATSA